MNGTPPVIEMCVLGMEWLLWQVLSQSSSSFCPVDIVRRLNPDDAQPRDGLILIEQSQEEEIVEKTDGNELLLHKSQLIHVGVFCMPEDGAFEPIDPIINQRASDVWRALMDQTYEGNKSLRYGGQALATSSCLGVQPLNLPDGVFAGFIIPVDVRYCHRENDPTFNGV